MALVLHYKSEGHSLLSTDGSFPYSDKDVELVCGSLVSVENNSLRVIHLTIKQYLTSSLTDTNSPLHVELASASSKLASVCLDCIRTKCIEIVARSDVNQNWTDRKGDPTKFSSARGKVPFLEYASFSWFLHLMDCDGINLFKLTKLLHDTFESQATFYWIEFCFTLRSNTVLQLTVSLGEVREWIKDMGDDSEPSQDPNCRFFERWCSTMHQLMNDYGSFLSKRPSKIHSLDLKLAFSDHGLTELYEKYGNVSAREKSLQFIHYQNPGRLRKPIPPHRQLQPSSVSRFVIYDPRRDVYLWNDLEAGQQVLFAQSAVTGRRLRPAIDTEKCPGVDSLVAKDMSTDGKYLGLLQELEVPYNAQLLIIWEIDKDLDFRKPMHGAPWARTIFKRVLDATPVLWRSQSIVFRTDGCCCTPFGLVHLPSGTVQPHAEKAWAQMLQSFRPTEPDGIRAIYSGNGEFVFLKDNEVVKKVTYPALTVVAEFTLGILQLSVSHSGRYLIDCWYGSPFDTVLRKTVNLPNERGLDFKWLYYSHDENEVLKFNSYLRDGLNVLKVSHYVGLLDRVYLRAQQEMFIEDLISKYDIWIDGDMKKAVMISPSGEVQRISIDKNIIFLDPTERHNDACQLLFSSQDCNRWASIHHGSRETLVQTFVFDEPGVEPRCLELKLPSLLDIPAFTPISMSSDLSILVVDRHIYNLATPDDQAASNPIITINLTGLVLAQGEKGLRFVISNCVIGPDCKYIGYLDSVLEPRVTGHDVLHLFRLDVKGRSANRVVVPLPCDMENVSIDFHPSLPLMTIGYTLVVAKVETRYRASQVDDQTLSERSHIFHAALVDLRTISVKALEIPEDATELRMG